MRTAYRPALVAALLVIVPAPPGHAAGWRYARVVTAPRLYRVAETATTPSGRFVALVGMLDAPPSTGGSTQNAQVVVYDTAARISTLVTVGRDGKPLADYTHGVTISADGRYVGFVSRAANVVTGDSNASTDLFVRDLRTRRTTRASVDRKGRELPRGIFDGVLSPNGRTVAFTTCSPVTSAVSGAECPLYLRDLRTGQAVAVSADAKGVPHGANAPRFSPDGRWLAFLASGSYHLTPDSPDDYHQRAYVYDTVRRTIVMAPDDATTVQGQRSQEDHSYAAVDPTGTWVATSQSSYESAAGLPDSRTNLVNLGTGAVTKLGSTGTPMFCCAAPPVFSADGQWVVYGVGEADAAGQALDVVYRRSLRTGAVERVSAASPSPCASDLGCTQPRSVAVATDRTASRLVLVTQVRQTGDDADGWGDAYLVTR
jgi:Tol biopolymer transport system component